MIHVYVYTCIKDVAVLLLGPYVIWYWRNTKAHQQLKYLCFRPVISAIQPSHRVHVMGGGGGCDGGIPCKLNDSSRIMHWWVSWGSHWITRVSSLYECCILEFNIVDREPVTWFESIGTNWGHLTFLLFSDSYMYMLLKTAWWIFISHSLSSAEPYS